MESIFTIMKQDLEVAEKGNDGNDFNLVLFIGNRLMTNSLVSDKNGIMLLGYMVRELGAELLFIQKNRKDNLDAAKREAKTYLKSLKEQVIKECLDPKVYWEIFYKIENKFRKYLLSNHESAVYDEQNDFSKIFAIKMLDIFYSNKNKIYLKNNNLIAIMANEFGRNFNEHGGEEALIVYLVFRALDNYYSFARKTIDDANEVRTEEIKLNGFIEKIYKLKTIILEKGKEELYNDASAIVDNLGNEYRLLVLNYSVPIIEVEEKIELSEETKQKLGDAIMQSLHISQKKEA